MTVFFSIMVDLNVQFAGRIIVFPVGEESTSPGHVFLFVDFTPNAFLYFCINVKPL